MTEPRAPEPSLEDPASWVGRQIGKYEIVRPIGQGGMGSVFEAVHSAIGKRVAMKFVTRAMAENRDAVERFLREAQAASAVESGHIVEIFDTGEDDDGRPYIVMELLRGESLAACITREGTIGPTETMRIVGQLLRGLVRAHEAGIVHRDLKPDNVFLVDRDGEASLVKLLDFGISKVQRIAGDKVKTLTREGAVLGTPHYMSPEQAQGLDVDERTDLWAVGAISFECLTGRLAFEGTTYEQVIVQICTRPAPDVASLNPAVSGELAGLVRHALTQDRDQRVPSAGAFLDALHRVAPDVVPRRAERSLVGAEGSPKRATPRAGEFDETVEAGSHTPLGTESGVTRLATGSRGGRDGRLVTLAAAVLLMAGLAIMAGLMWSRSPEETSRPHRSLAATAAEPPAATASSPEREPSVTTADSGAPPAASAPKAASSDPPASSAPAKAKPPIAKSPPPPPPPPSKPPPASSPPKPPASADDLTLQLD